MDFYSEPQRMTLSEQTVSRLKQIHKKELKRLIPLFIISIILSVVLFVFLFLANPRSLFVLVLFLAFFLGLLYWGIYAHNAQIKMLKHGKYSAYSVVCTNKEERIRRYEHRSRRRRRSDRRELRCYYFSNGQQVYQRPRNEDWPYIKIGSNMLLIVYENKYMVPEIYPLDDYEIL